MIARRALVAGTVLAGPVLGLSALAWARAAPAAVLPLAAMPISRLGTPWWRQRHAAKLAEAKAGPVELVFLGDSITQNWEKAGGPAWQDFAPIWRRYYGDRHALNLGFGGDATSHLLWRMQHGEIDGIAPKLAVILIGANNMGILHWAARDTVTGIAAVVDEARRRLPRTRILLLSVLPSVRNAYVTESTLAINAALALRYGGGGVPEVTFLDVTPVFGAPGVVDPALFYDPLLTPAQAPLHPTAATQQRLAAFIEPTVARLMGDRDHRT